MTHHSDKLLAFDRKIEFVKHFEKQYLVLRSKVFKNKREKLSQPPGSPLFIFKRLLVIPCQPRRWPRGAVRKYK